MESPNYSFSLRIDNTEFSVGGDKEFVEANIQKWLTLFKDKLPENLLGKSDVKGEAKEASSDHHHRSKVTLPEFIKLKAPKNFSDLLLTVFFYYERYEGMENTGVGVGTVKLFVNKLAHHPSDEEIETLLNQLLDDKFLQLMPGTEYSPKYQVTFSGEQCVKAGFAE